MCASSLYNSKEYKHALIASGHDVVPVTDNFFAVKRSIKLPLLGEKMILEARGTPNEKEASVFKEKSKKYFYGTIATNVLHPQTKFLTREYHKFSNFTLLIDLNKEIPSLWKSLEKKSARWGVKTAEKNKLTFSVDVSDKDLQKFYKIYKETSRKGGFFPEPINFLTSLSNTQISRLFLVRSSNSIIAGALIFFDRENKCAILDLTASTDKGAKLQAMPFIYWNLILYAKREGMHFFDLGGYDKEARTREKTYTVNKFKERFGGVITEQPIYSTNLVYPCLRATLSSFRFLRRFYKKN